MAGRPVRAGVQTGVLAWIIFVYLVLSVLFKDDGSAQKAKRRREKQFWKSQRALQRYERLPPMVRVINEEKRFKRARRSALAAVMWALGCDEWTRDEIAGSVVKVLHKNKELVFDHDALHRECLAVLRQATCLN